MTLRLIAVLILSLLLASTASAHRRYYHSGPWCGAYARTLVGRDPGPEFNRAAEWLRWGMPSGPRVGAMVVWPHHVGKIVGPPDGAGRWAVLSGNTGRDRSVHVAMRSVLGARFRVSAIY